MKAILKKNILVLFLLLSAGTAIAQTITYSGPYTFPVNSGIPTISPVYTGSPAPNGQTITFAGTGSAGSANGTGTSASFNQPLGTAVDASGNIYVADAINDLIRKITPTGVVSTFAGTGSAGSANGTGTAASFYHPVGMCIDASGNIFVADENNNLIRKITPSGTVSTLAGSGLQGSADGTGTSASFYNPCGVAVDIAGNVYVGDNSNNKIRKITASGVVSTIAGSGAVGSADGSGTAATFDQPFSVALDPFGNLYVADRYNHKIRKIILATGAVSTVAGSGTAGFADNTGALASFNYPTGIISDASGNIYVTDYHNNRIRKVSPAGVVTTLAGTATAGSANGIGTATTFNYPFAIAVDASGYLYVGDLNADLIRKVASTAFGISPYLPAGLSFNTSNGCITGTPIVISPATNYTAAVYNSVGFGSNNVNITIGPAGVLNPSQNQNYILTFTPRISGLTTDAALSTAANDPAQAETNIKYFDGLGRPLQTVQAKGSPTGRDVVQPVVYDQFGREAVKYLPYAVTGSAPSDGSFKTTAVADQGVFYTTPPTGVSQIQYPSAGTNFEPSPLDRVTEQGAPGVPWQLSTSGINGSGHTLGIAYGTNAANDVILWSVNASGTGATGTADYSAGQLYSTTRTDENGNSNIEYKDVEGNIVCKKAQSGSNPVTYLATYYVYDGNNNLAYVIPPIPSASNPAVSAYPASFAETDAVFLNYIYGYHYDNRNRVVEKKIPGKGWEYMVYNTLDQVIATQDAVQRGKATQEWTFNKYDGQGRVALTGIYQYSGSTPNTSYRVALQTTVAGVSKLWETPVATGTGYTSSAWPTSWTGATLSITYYDNYANIPPGMPAAFITPVGASVMTSGLLLASQTNVLGSSNMLWTVNYYDDLGRVIQTDKQHYLGGVLSPYNYDVFLNTYDFTNEVTATTRKHYNATNTVSPVVAIANTYTFDNVGRKKQTTESVNGATPVILSELDYNEMGQLMAKNLHSSNNGSNYLQNTSYAYNERGWLSKINDPSVAPTTTKLFAEQLNYNVPLYGAPAQYNGNIAEQDYNAGVSTRHQVTYSYDNLNRLTTGNSNEGFSETAVGYDAMGNISALTRTGIDAAVLAYKYTDAGNNSTGNLLQKVTNNGTTTLKNYGYDGNGNVTNDGTNTFTYNLLNLPQTVTATGLTLSYTYDAAGEKLRKISSTLGTTDYISGIQYKTNSTVIDFIQTEEGRAINAGSSWNYEYTLTDHLGNNRVTFDMLNGKVGEDDYYPFGLNVHRQQNAGNLYLYNKKELQNEITEYDYGARFYDPVIGRWTTIDPLAEKVRRWTPYNYGWNNPIRMIDPDGMFAKPGDLFKTEDEAAHDFGMFYNGQSIKNGKEMTSYTYKVEKNGETFYTYTEASGGGSDQNITSQPEGVTVVAIDHTHGKYDEGYANNVFSGSPEAPTEPGEASDIKTAKRDKIDNYVATPNGSLQKYDVKTDKITTIATDLPSDPKDPDRLNKVSPDPPPPVNKPVPDKPAPPKDKKDTT